jgi:hypothetical protein
MKYAILVYETEQDIRDRPQTMPAYSAYSQALAEAGVAAGGAALHPSHTATTIRLQNGQRNVQDGPYADTKEQLGGCLLLTFLIWIPQWIGQPVVQPQVIARSKSVLSCP